MSSAPLEQLYAEHVPAARRLARSLAPAAEADDLVSESFARVIAQVQRGREPREFGPYLMTTVRHQAADAARGRHRLVLVPDPEPPAAPSAADQAASRDESRRAALAFRSLPERWRQVLWATEVEGVRPAELAARLGLSPNAVAQLAVRAREGLREAYLAQHVGPHMPEPCRTYAQLLPASARGHLGTRQRAQLAGHLRHCARCSGLSEELASLNTRLAELIGPAALAWPAGRRMLSGLLQLHKPVLLALGTGTLAAVAATAAVPFVTAAPPPVQAQAHSTARAGSPSAAAPARQHHHYVPRHSKDRGGGTPPGQALQAGPASVVTRTAGAAGSALSGTGQQLGGTVSGVLGTAGQAVGGLLPVAAPAGQLVSQAGQQLGGAVSAVTGSAGQTAGAAVQGVTGTLSGLLGGS